MGLHKISEERLAEFKKLCEEKGIKYETDAEYERSAQHLVDFVKVLVDIDMEERKRKARLENEPKGFSMTGEGRNCSLCKRSVYGEDGWYDKWGFKCPKCQNAVDKHIIPGSMCRDYNNEKCITVSSLSWKINLKHQTIMKLVRQGKIKVRQVPKGATIILRKENPNILDILNEELKLQAEKKANH